MFIQMRMFQNVKLRNFTRMVLQYVIPAGAVGYLIFEFSDLSMQQLRFWADGVANPTVFLGILGSVILLSGANWALEAAKWRFLSAKVESISFWRALAGVLYAIGVGFITPRQVGELAGKVVVLQKKNHLQGLVLSSAGSFVQFCITFFMGHVGLLLGMIVLEASGASVFYQAVVGYSFFASFLSILIIVFYKRIAQYFSKWKLPEYVTKAIQTAQLLSARDFRFVFALSFLRYVIFLAQFHLLLLMLGARVTPVESVVVLSITYLIMLGMPISGILDSGIRGSLALFVFQIFTNDRITANVASELTVVPAMISLWIINLALPAIVGAWIAFSGKIFSKPVSNHS